MSFPSTTLAQTNDPKEIQKADLDLLDKINQISATLSTLQTSVSAFTKTIVTSASNANGFYIQFSDGTMIQYGTVPSPGTGNSTWTLPVSFVNSSFRVSITPNSNAGSQGPATIVSKAVGSLVFDSCAGIAAKVACDVLAIGSWK